MGSVNAKTIELLLREHAMLNDSIARFDDSRSKAKDWLITSAGVVLLVVFTTGQPKAFWAGVLLVFAFAVMEVSYTLTQELAIRRTEKLELWIDDWRKSDDTWQPPLEFKFGLNQTFITSWSFWETVKAILDILKWRTFGLPLYLTFLAGFLVAAILGPSVDWWALPTSSLVP